ncbi:N-acetyltransferase family protein [Amycolatopsis sp. NPDC004378]
MTREWTVRTAVPADLAGIARVADRSGLGPHETGADPAYVRHLAAHGRVVVADAAEVLGYAATIPVGGRTMLTDAFVVPGAQGKGIGGALLDEVFAPGVPRMTFSSRDPRAIAAYSRRGLAATWPLLYLHGDPAELTPPAGWRVEATNPGRAAAAETRITGIDRRAGYEYWTGRPGGAAFVVRAAGDVVAAGCLGGGGDQYGLTRLRGTPGADAVAAVVTALTALRRAASVCLPATHPAVPRLLASGFTITDFDLFMTTEPAAPPGHDVFSPGLY